MTRIYFIQNYNRLQFDEVVERLNNGNENILLYSQYSVNIIFLIIHHSVFILISWKNVILSFYLPWESVPFSKGSQHLVTSKLSMMTSSNGNIFRVTGHLCGEFTGPRWIPRTKASDAELWCFLWSLKEKHRKNARWISDEGLQGDTNFSSHQRKFKFVTGQNDIEGLVILQKDLINRANKRPNNPKWISVSSKNKFVRVNKIYFRCKSIIQRRVADRHNRCDRISLNV